MTAQHEVKYPVTIPLKVVMHSKEEAGKNVAHALYEALKAHPDVKFAI